MTSKPDTKGKPRFRPMHPEKYRGDPTSIYYRSGWELSCMRKFDSNPNVLEWSSEEVVVPYRSQLDVLKEQKDGRKRTHRYFIDFYVKLRLKDGSVSRRLIEVKPLKETVKPDRTTYKGKNAEKRFRYDYLKWIVNDAKWAAAREFAEDRGMTFHLYTEKMIYG